MERGVITNPLSLQLQMVGFSLGTTITPELVRYYMLYWDKLLIPSNSLIGTTIPDEADLIAAGKLLKPHVNLMGRFEGNEVAHAIFKAQSDLADLFSKDTSTDWSLHQHGAGQFYFPDMQVEQRQTLRFSLSNVLPVPDNNVNIIDILDFKEHRADELGELHEHLDSLYLEVLKSPDPSLSSKKSIRDLQKTLNNLDLVSKERFKFRNYVNLEWSYTQSVKDIITSTVGFGAAGFGLTEMGAAAGFTIPIATATGALLGLASGLNVSIKPKVMPKSPTSPLIYLEQASKVGIVRT